MSEQRGPQTVAEAREAAKEICARDGYHVVTVKGEDGPDGKPVAGTWPPPLVTVDFEGHPMQVDREADMGMIELRPYDDLYYITDVSHEEDGVLVDRDREGRALGVEIFLCNGAVRPESEPVIRRLLTEVRR